MSGALEGLSPLQRAALALEKMQARLDAAERARSEPIAIVGMACRFPGGADSPETFWRLLRDGVDATREVPPDRWDADAWYDPSILAAGKIATRRGGFLDRVDLFDRGFFGLSPRRAAAVDPQQRLLLEVAWEALEHAGFPQPRFAGSRTGVFVGASSMDYGLLNLQVPDRIDELTMESVALSTLANRVSHQLDLRGASVTVDAACAASLVAVHMACHSLRTREADAALACGVNLILAPNLTVAYSQAGMLAPDGRCKTLDAAADGFGRGEGCGVIVLERLSDARARGDRILAVIRGSAVNHDGRGATFTAPSRPSQQAVVRDALASGLVAPADVSYLEMHGTGTPMGDATEVEALASVLGTGRVGQRCALGAVKTNIGHLEAAAGIAGLIKVVLSLRHEHIPPLVHLETPNPELHLERTPFDIPVRGQPWPAGERTRVAGVSAFGYTGTNAHVVVAEAPPEPVAAPEMSPERAWFLLPLSARSPAALTDLAGAFRTLLAGGTEAPGALADFVHTAAVRRTHHAHRLAVTGRSGAELAARLDTFLLHGAGQGIQVGTVPSAGGPAVAFLFPDRTPGPHRGAELASREPAFREAWAASHDAGSGTEAASGTEATSGVDATGSADPARAELSALQMASAALWRAWGIRPDAVAAYGWGERAAARVAGLPAFAGHRPARLIADGYRVLLAIGPCPDSLRGEMERAAAGADGSALTLPLAGGDDEQGMLLESLGALFVRGCPVAWSGLYPGVRAHAELPTYPWQRERYWRDTRPESSALPSE